MSSGPCRTAIYQESEDGKLKRVLEKVTDRQSAMLKAMGYQVAGRQGSAGVNRTRLWAIISSTHATTRPLIRAASLFFARRRNVGLPRRGGPGCPPTQVRLNRKQQFFL